MGLGKFARRVIGLQEVFPSSDRSIAYPDALDGTVSPVFEFPSKAAALDRAIRAAQTSNSALTPTLSLGTLAQGVFEEWLYASVFHDDAATARTIIVNLLDPSGAGVQIGRFVVNFAESVSFVNAHYIHRGLSSIMNVPIKVWVPGGFQVQLVGSTAGAAYSFTVQRLLVVHPTAESAVWP